MAKLLQIRYTAGIKPSRFLPFVLGCFLTFGAFALHSAVAHGTPQGLPKGFPFGKD